MPLQYKNNIFWIYKNVISRNYAKMDGYLRNVRLIKGGANVLNVDTLTVGGSGGGSVRMLPPKKEKQ